MRALLRFCIAGVLLAAAVPAAGADAPTRERDIVYGPSARQRLDIYRPAEVADSAPLVVFFYGGGWQEGSKDKPDIPRTAASLTAAGLVVAVPDYRVYPEVTFPGFVEDAAAAVALVWQRERLPGGTSRPLFLVGHSAGAHIAAMLAFDERYLVDAGLPTGSVTGFIGLSGPYDFRPGFRPFDRIFPPETRDRSLPGPFIDGGEAPALLVTGDADEVVDMASTMRFAQAIRAEGGSAALLVEPGGDHLAPYLALADPASPIRDAVIAFIKETAGSPR